MAQTAGCCKRCPDGAWDHNSTVCMDAATPRRFDIVVSRNRTIDRYCFAQSEFAQSDNRRVLFRAIGQSMGVLFRAIRNTELSIFLSLGLRQLRPCHYGSNIVISCKSNARALENRRLDDVETDRWRLAVGCQLFVVGCWVLGLDCVGQTTTHTCTMKTITANNLVTIK